MMRATSICLLTILFVSKAVANDTDTTIIIPPYVAVVLPNTLPNQTTAITLPQYNSKIIRPNHYLNGLGFFCKKEWLIEQKTKIPLRLRLGSLAYTNVLEQKAGSPRYLPATFAY